MGWKYNRELSEWAAKEYGHLFEIKGCYENVFRLATDVPELRPVSQLNILFCYMLGAGGFHYRHAFCLYDGQIVEPLLHLNMAEKNLDAIVPIKQMDMKEYHRLLLADGRYDLWNALQADGIQAFNANRMELNPVDLADIVSNVAKNSDDFLRIMHNAMNGQGIPFAGETPPGKQIGGMLSMDIYKEKGFADRNEYIKALARQHGLDFGNVRIWAHTLGPDADFTDLPKLCEEKGIELANAPDPYRARGYNNPAHYFSTLADEYVIPVEWVEKEATELKPADHFGKLPGQLQKIHDDVYAEIDAAPGVDDEPDDDIEI